MQCESGVGFPQGQYLSTVRRASRTTLLAVGGEEEEMSGGDAAGSSALFASISDDIFHRRGH